MCFFVVKTREFSLLFSLIAKVAYYMLLAKKVVQMTDFQPHLFIFSGIFGIKPYLLGSNSRKEKERVGGRRRRDVADPKRRSRSVADQERKSFAEMSDS